MSRSRRRGQSNSHERGAATHRFFVATLDKPHHFVQTVLLQLVQLVNQVAAFPINVTTGAGTPIYRQIVDQVRLGVATGALAPGQAMPSVRTLAEQLVVNPNTVARAYADLVRDGVLESHQGRGVFVASKKRQGYHPAPRPRRLPPA